MRWLLRAFCPLALACTACGQVPARPSAPEKPEPPPVASTPSTAATPSLPVPPENGLCVVRGKVSRGDVVWKLRTRLDAIPTMQVEEGLVTGWLAAGARGYGPNALAQVENSAMMIRALVAAEDLKVVVAQAYPSLPGHFPDGFTHRPVVKVEGGDAWVDIRIEGATSTISILPCSTFGLVPGDVGVERLLPPARGTVVVKKGAYVKTDSGSIPVDGFWTPWGVTKPEGIRAELRGDDTDPLARSVSFNLCGGTVVGFVPKSYLVGRPILEHGSSARCPSVGAGTFLEHAKLDEPVTCPRDLPVSLRSATFEDPVGVLKAGARFQVSGKEARGTMLVTVETPPAEPFDGVSFSVRTSDLEACVPNERRL